MVMDRPTASRRLHGALAVLALLLVAAHPSIAATKNTTAKAATRVIADCSEMAIRPKTIGLACADGYLQLIDARWSTWTTTRATGTGTYEYNDCEPYCAAGKIHRVKATFALSGVVVTKKYGRLFSKVTVRWSGKSQEFDLPTMLLSDVMAATATAAR